MHRVKPHRRKKIYFVIMGSVFFSNSGMEIHEQYDLKGSTKGRRSQPNESMKKDLDLIESGTFVKIGREKAKLFRSHIQMDTDFLRKNGIMDYSLLLGIHYRNRDARRWKTKGKNRLQRNLDAVDTTKHPLPNRPSTPSTKIEEVVLSFGSEVEQNCPNKKQKTALVK